MNAKRLCGAYSVGTQVQGCPSIVAPAASYAVRFSHHAEKLLPLARQTGLPVPMIQKTGTENPRVKQRSTIITPE